MVEKIEFIKYKKFYNMSLDFSTDKINIISGPNGTCKTSLLHIISNSFKEPTNKTEFTPEQRACLAQVRTINHVFNPKIESLTKGDKQFNDPAKGASGTLFKVTFTDLEPSSSITIDFRRHNSSEPAWTEKSRYRITPKYAHGSGVSLISYPIIYLSLTRLFPFGEFSDDGNIDRINKKLPDNYQAEIATLYSAFTNLTVENVQHHKMGAVKHKSDFTTNKEGIDSNTISAGEDNLYIILTALISLKYYFETFHTASILLIDEIDATLHPAFQIKLLNLLMQFMRDYKIQVFFTTHSLTLIEYALSKHQNIVYLLNNPGSICQLEKVDMQTINRTLLNQTIDSEKIFIAKKIPIFTEDAEAKLLLEILFDYFHDTDKEKFGKIRNFLYIIDGICIGSDILANMFNNTIIDNFKSSICILDGDKNSYHDLSKNIICLPGKDSPEKFLFEYAKILVESNSEFWRDSSNIQNGYTSDTIIDVLISKYLAIEAEYNQMKDTGKSTKGFRREKYKTLFNSNIELMKALFGFWIKQNPTETKKFLKNLQIVFFKASKLINIDISLWPKIG